jgi:hypothetical protein
VRMPVGRPLKKLVKRLVKSLKGQGSIPPAMDAESLSLHYDGQAVDMQHNLLQLDKQAVQGWMAASAESESQGADPAYACAACIINVVTGKPPAAAAASTAASTDTPSVESRSASVAAPAEPLHANPAPPSSGTVVLAQFRHAGADEHAFPTSIVRLASDKPLGEQLKRLVKALIKGGTISRRTVADSLRIKYDGEDVPSGHTLAQVDEEAVLDWVAGTPEEQATPACILDVVTPGGRRR